MSKPKIFITLTVLTCVIVGCLSIPLPLHIEATFIIEPDGVEHVHTKTPGELVEFNFNPGDPVKQGEVIAKLANPEMEDEKRDLILKRDLQIIKAETQLRLGNTSQMVVAHNERAALDKQIAEVQRQLDDLEIRAPIEGRVVAPPRVAAADLDTLRKQLSSWDGQPLDKKNYGATLESRTHIVSLAPTESYQAIVLIDQGDRNELIHKDDFVEKLKEAESHTIQLKFDHLPAKTYEGTVEYVSKSTTEYAPEMLSNKMGGQLATVTDKQGRERLQSPVYQATVKLGEDAGLLRSGMRGKARFLVDKRTGWQWIRRYLYTTLKFRL